MLPLESPFLGNNSTVLTLCNISSEVLYIFPVTLKSSSFSTSVLEGSFRVLEPDKFNIKASPHQPLFQSA